jgi:hypothetical protein
MIDTSSFFKHGRLLLTTLLLMCSIFVGPVVAASTDQSVVCDIGTFKSLVNIGIQSILVGFSPIAALGLLGERLVNALPFISQSRRKSFMEWRGKIIGAAAGMYVGLPIGYEIATNAGFPIPSCIEFVPF